MDAALPVALPDPRVSHDELPSGEWLETWLAISRRVEPDALGLSRALLAGVSRPRTFALLHEDGQVLVTALGTLSPGWLGLSCLAVREDARRRGIARAMLAALAAWAQGAARRRGSRSRTTTRPPWRSTAGSASSGPAGTPT